jgi:NAD(P)-dependent dehydrogenase (short-subunit alcohol dehydrogenase family)
MSKFAVVALSETLYHELTQDGTKIGVSVLCPELINTGIGRSDRNRPSHLKRDEDHQDPGRDMVEGAIRELTPTGLDPSEMANRVVDAIREGLFYILSEPGGSWRKACESRLEDVRLTRNPTLQITAAN